MQDVEIMKAFEAVQNLDENIPNFLFLEELFLFLLFDDLLVEVAVV